MITKQERNSIRRINKKISAELDRILANEKLSGELTENIGKVLVAHNTIKIAAEVALDESTPFDLEFLIELVVRMSSYLITAGPTKHLPYIISEVRNGIGPGVARMVAQGDGIKGEWEDDDAATIN